MALDAIILLQFITLNNIWRSSYYGLFTLEYTVSVLYGKSFISSWWNDHLILGIQIQTT